MNFANVFMEHFITLALLAGLGSTMPAFSQKQPESTPAEKGQIFNKKLPDDLPQSKLLFVKQPIIDIPAERPSDMNWLYFRADKRNNEAATKANAQLLEAVRQYPFAYRITTPDSIDYYRTQGYKYKLYHSSFNSLRDGSFQGTTSHVTGGTRTYTSTSVDLYVQDLNNNDKYIFDSFSETFVYYYKGIVEMLVKKVSKQFDVKK